MDVTKIQTTKTNLWGNTKKKKDNTIKIEVIKIIDKYSPQMKTSDSGNFIGKLLPTSKE